MSPSREEDLFALAVEKPVEKRAAFLDAECEGDPDLRQRLEALLAAHEEPESLAGPDKWTRLDDEAAPAEQVGSQVGRYKLLEKLGVGGFGEVWEAEQKEPVRRRVALKVIKLGMDTQQVVARFEAERQALAMMDHPNIAKVFDAGTTEVGRPYFVMELVRGIKITEYCDQANLSTKDRLDLFIKVCHAIQHAHQKGIIHRDIKPSNILVTLHDPAAAGVPKVIDFGIAKATEGRLADATIHTQLHQFIGTPAYMSPEQAAMSGLDIDTRSDIYSLGVLLYELLAGSTPFDAKELMSQDIDWMRKTIREKEPQRPSTRLTQVLVAAEVTRRTAGNAEESASSRRRLQEVVHQLKGDLDWIVMKCLEKDRQRRYDTANGLAADLKRHLDNEPVLARPPSAAYKFQKAFRRNKLVFSAGAAVAVALILGVIVSAWQVVRAKRAEADAKAALHFIQDDVLSQASPGYQPDRELTVRALLERIAGRLDQATGRPPLVEASIRQTLGSVYAELSDYSKAARQYDGALQLQRKHLGESHPDTLRSLYGLVMAHWWNGDLAQAEPLTRQGLELSTQALDEKDPLTLQFMQARAFVVMTLGEMPWTELEPFYLKALKLHREVLGTNDLGTLKLIQGLSHGYVINWQEAKAESLTVEALDRSQRALGVGPDHPQTATLTIALGWIYAQLNQLEKAEVLARRSWVLRSRILGETNSRTLSSALILATVYVQQQQFDKAEPLTADALTQIRGLADFNDLYLPHQLSELGWAYLEQGQVAKAAELCDLGLQKMPRKPDVSHVMLPRIITQLGAVRLAQEKYSEAEALLRESSRLAEKRWPDAAYRYYVMSLLGASLAGPKNYADAEPLLLQSCQGLQQRQASLPPILNAPRRITEAHERLVQLYDAWGKPAQAAEWKQKLAAFQQANKVSDNKSKTP